MGSFNTPNKFVKTAGPMTPNPRTRERPKNQAQAYNWQEFTLEKATHATNFNVAQTIQVGNSKKRRNICGSPAASSFTQRQNSLMLL